MIEIVKKKTGKVVASFDNRYARCVCACELLSREISDSRKAGRRRIDFSGCFIRIGGGGVRTLEYEIPVVADIDAAILESSENCGLNMGDWVCGTTRCRGGWAVFHGGEAGKKLCRRIGFDAAGRLIYLASRPDKEAPSFYQGTGEAIADIKRCAAKSNSKSPKPRKAK